MKMLKLCKVCGQYREKRDPENNKEKRRKI